MRRIDRLYRATTPRARLLAALRGLGAAWLDAGAATLPRLAAQDRRTRGIAGAIACGEVAPVAAAAWAVTRGWAFWPGGLLLLLAAAALGAALGVPAGRLAGRLAAALDARWPDGTRPVARGLLGHLLDGGGALGAAFGFCGGLIAGAGAVSWYGTAWAGFFLLSFYGGGRALGALLDRLARRGWR